MTDQVERSERAEPLEPVVAAEPVVPVVPAEPPEADDAPGPDDAAEVSDAAETNDRVETNDPAETNDPVATDKPVAIDDAAEEDPLEQTRDLTDRAVSAPRRRRRRVRRLVRSVVPPTLVLGLFVGAWFLVSNVLLAPERRFLLPPPDDVVRVGFQDAHNRADLLAGLRLSATIALAGLAVSVLVGLLLAILMSQAAWIERSLYPYVVVLQTIPILALVPLFAYWFGYGYVARVVVCVLVSLFPIVANTLFGLRSVDIAHRELFALHGAGRLTRLVKLQLPAALPAIFTGLRIAAGLSVIGAIVGDYFFRQGQLGLGAMIDNYRYRLQAEQMFAAVLLSSLFGIAVFLVFGGVARRVAAWHQSASDFPNR